MNDSKYLTVGAITKYLKHKFDTDNNLKTVFIKGEISNFKAHTSGHLYFSIKDEVSKINAIMFARDASKITFKPADGTKVLICGRISVYEATGGYQIYASEMLEDGVGSLHIEFEKLKKKLAAEGLFDDLNKKKIPELPNRVGIITAATGAAIRDILSTIKRRYPICETILFPSLVQGDNAAVDIVKNIELAKNYNLDVLIVGRGGGSIEDMWPFNEEIVARAIYECPIPIVSAVGHEIDFTISDFVADLRAPTPTGAAEMVVPNIFDLSKHISQLNIRINESIVNKVNVNKINLDNLKNSFVIKNPMTMYDNKKQQISLINEKLNYLIMNKLENTKIKLGSIKGSFVINNPAIMYDSKKQSIKTINEKLNYLINNKISTNKNKFSLFKSNYILNNPNELYKTSSMQLSALIEKIEILNPLSVLKRGYTLNYQGDRVVSSINNIDMKKDIKTVFNDGYIISKVIDIKENSNE